jgi:glutathione peroxidase
MSVYDYTMQTIDGQQKALSDYAGKWLLIVNVASKCGLTPQYAGLEALYRKYADKGLMVLGFPCNQFAGQEPGSEDEIKQFCSTQYEVSFPLFAKIDVNGETAHPLFRELGTALPGQLFDTKALTTDPMGKFLSAKYPAYLAPDAIRWNFTKFLIGPKGVALKRYAPGITPDKIDADLATQLG